MKSIYIFLLVLILALLNTKFIASQDTTESTPILVDEEEVVHPAKLLVLKKAPEATVENGEWTVDIIVYNVGDRPAYNIDLNDGFWAPELFPIVKGSTSHKYEILNPGESVTHSYTISGKTLGTYETTQTTVTFKTSEDEENSHTTRSNPIPPIQVVTQAQYDRMNAKQFPTPLAYGLLSIVPIVLPAILHLFANNKIARLADGTLKSE